jgi:glycerophosphoryl diester phosphodiesterase
MILRRRDGRPLRIGHRGAAGLAPANTLAGLDAALAAGLDGVEIDVVAIDGVVRLAHSARERTGESPTLDDALALIAERGADVLVQVDVKRPGYEEPVVEALGRHDLRARAVVTSYFHWTLRTVRRVAPEVAIGVGYPYDRTGLAERYLPERAVRIGLGAMRRALPRRIDGMMRASGADAAMLHHLVLSATVMDRCRALDVPVWAWTVNDPAALDRVLRLGVDAVITDEPGIFGSGLE